MKAECFFLVASKGPRCFAVTPAQSVLLPVGRPVISAEPCGWRNVASERRANPADVGNDRRARTKANRSGRATRILNWCPDAFVEVDESGLVREWNPQAEALLGWSAGDVVGRPMDDRLLVSPVEETPFFRNGPGDSHTVVFRHYNGTNVALTGSFFASGAGTGGTGAFLRPAADLLVGPKETAEGTGNGAKGPVSAGSSPVDRRGRDHLTGLVDRSRFITVVDELLVRAEMTHGALAVVLMDLDRFESVNSSLGSTAGDDVLRQLAERLVAVAGGVSALARFGGDEFAAVIHHPDGAQGAAEALVGRGRAMLAEPFRVGGHDLYLEASWGLAYNTFGVNVASELVAQAETAMYEAKRRGGAGGRTYGEELRIEALDRMTTEHALHGVLDRQELMLHYQPVVEVADRSTVGVEALLRWDHPERGLVAPYRFIPVAEQSGMIIPIGAWVLAEACQQIRSWQRHEQTGPRNALEVNLSARQIDDPRLVGTVEGILARTGLPPELLTLEITESSLMVDAVVAVKVLRALKDLGVMLAIDDFGTGYSSLSYLQRFPIDVLKIDRSFVSALGRATQSETIVAAIINLAHGLGLQVVAEGVETEQQLEVLRSMECDLAQGFLFSKPMAAPDLMASMANPASR